MPTATAPIADSRAEGSASHLVLANGRDPAAVAFEAALVSFFIDAADLLGVPKSVAAIYGTCFASPEPLSLADIDERLDISIGSISQGLRVLREVGALKEVSTPSDRRELFTPDLALRKLVERWLDGRLQKQVAAGRDRLQVLIKSVPGGRSASAKVLRNRLEALQTWQDKARALMPVVKAFLKLT